MCSAGISFTNMRLPYTSRLADIHVHPCMRYNLQVLGCTKYHSGCPPVRLCALAAEQCQTPKCCLVPYLCPRSCYTCTCTCTCITRLTSHRTMKRHKPRLDKQFTQSLYQFKALGINKLCPYRTMTADHIIFPYRCTEYNSHAP